MEKSRLFVAGLLVLILLIGFVVYHIASMNRQVFTHAETSMKCWPALADYGKTLFLEGGTLFFYDVDGAAFADNAVDAAQKPVLVLLHGLGDEADTWRNLLPELARTGYRCIAPDLPDFGRSSWQGQISLRVHAEAVLALMRESGAASPARPVVVIGSSMGAIVAEIIGFERPDLDRPWHSLTAVFPLQAALTGVFCDNPFPQAGTFTGVSPKTPKPHGNRCTPFTAILRQWTRLKSLSPRRG
jgi:pimeloyl-ACP methyl ester carboxylesterase